MYDIHPEETELSSDPAYQLVYNNVLYALFIIVLPICILVLLNIRLVKALKAHRRMQTQSTTMRSHAEHSMTYVLVIIVVVLIVCQLPARFTRVLWIVTPNKAQECGNYQFYMLPITNMFIVLNSAVNFIIIYTSSSTNASETCFSGRCSSDVQCNTWSSLVR